MVLNMLITYVFKYVWKTVDYIFVIGWNKKYMVYVEENVMLLTN